MGGNGSADEYVLSVAGGLDGFARDRLSFGKTLVCPLFIVWRDYKEYCAEWGFDQVNAAAFVFWLETQRGIAIIERGHGKRRRCVLGIGVLPHACND